MEVVGQGDKVALVLREVVWPKGMMTLNTDEGSAYRDGGRLRGI